MKQEEISTASTVSIWRPLLGSPGQGVSTACPRDVFDLPACMAVMAPALEQIGMADSLPKLLCSLYYREWR